MRPFRNVSSDHSIRRRAWSAFNGRMGLALGALVSLAGCGFATTQWTKDPLPLYDQGTLTYAAGDLGLRTVIRGRPFGGSAESFESAVTDAMYGQHFGPAVDFKTVLEHEPADNYRAVLVFDAPPSVRNDRLCDDLATLPRLDGSVGQEAGAVSVVAAFCLNRTALTAVVGSTRAASAEDPAFRALMGQLTRDLFPPVNRTGRSCGLPPLC